VIYAILSDVHANVHALRQVVSDAKAKGAERFVCLGDIVGYGPDPQQAVDLVRNVCAHVIAGNHDDAVCGRFDAKDFSDLAGRAVARHRETLTSPSLNWLRSLSHVLTVGDFLVAHGDFTDPEHFLYIQDAADAEANFSALDAQLAFVGHTHTPQLFLTGESGAVYVLQPTDFALENGKRYIVNPGSVGYPRESNGTCQSSYVLYDSNRREVTFHFLPFSVSSVMQHDGTRASRLRRLLPFAAGILLAAVIGAVWSFIAARSVPPRQDQVPALTIDARLIKTVERAISPDLRKFLPNLKLEAASAPVVLRTRCLDKDDRVVFFDSLLVKRSRTKPYKIPVGTVRVEISLLRENPSDKPVIVSFEPTFTP